MVTDSKATARVLVAWLIRIGFLVVAALAETVMHRNRKIKLLAAHHERQVFIKEAPSNDYSVQVRPSRGGSQYSM
jgi:hypothetical protein